MCSSPDRAVGRQPVVAASPLDRAAADALAAGMAAAHGWPPPTLLRAGANTTYRSDGVVIRVSRAPHDAAGAYALAEWLSSRGIETARPESGHPVAVDDRAGSARVATAWELVVPTADVADWVAVGAMVRRLHGEDPSAVPGEHRVPRCTSFPWWHVDERLSEVRAIVDGAAYEGVAAAVASHRGWVERAGEPARWVLCHGDIHHHNVIAGPGGPVILDWDLLCTGPPGWDHAPLLAMVQHWGAPATWYDDFAAGYGADLRDEPVTASLAVLRAVVATLLRVAAEGVERDPDGEAARRLRFWRGDPDAPTWTFV
jgi:Ser/Thr protein kinase RdoA (MazF antagonist)